MIKQWQNEIDWLKEQQQNKGYAIDLGRCVEEIAEIISTQGHSAKSLKLLKKYLDLLLSNKPFSELTDDEEEWKLMDNQTWQNKRYPSLVKDNDGNYRDVSRTVFIDTYNDTNETYTLASINNFIDKLFPISMPYIPEKHRFKVYGKMMYLDESGNDKTKNHKGSFNFIQINQIQTPSGELMNVRKEFDYREKITGRRVNNVQYHAMKNGHTVKTFYENDCDNAIEFVKKENCDYLMKIYYEPKDENSLEEELRSEIVWHI